MYMNEFIYETEVNKEVARTDKKKKRMSWTYGFEQVIAETRGSLYERGKEGDYRKFEMKKKKKKGRNRK